MTIGFEREVSNCCRATSTEDSTRGVLNAKPGEKLFYQGFGLPIADLLDVSESVDVKTRVGFDVDPGRGAVSAESGGVDCVSYLFL